MKKLRLRLTEGHWDPTDINGTGERLHFGINHYTTVSPDIKDPLRSQILGMIKDGKLVDENGEDPFNPKPKPEELPSHIIDSCELSDEENWPCQYSEKDSCPVDCVHDQTDNRLARGEVELEDESEEKPEEEAEPEPKPVPDAEGRGPLTPIGELIASLPKDFDEAMERISNMSYKEARKAAMSIGVKASGKKKAIINRIKKRLSGAWEE